MPPAVVLPFAVGLVVLAVLSAVISALETGFFALPRSRMEALRKQRGELGEGLAAEQPAPWEGAMSREEVERVRAALRALPEHDRKVILMHDFAQLTHEAIATSLGTTSAAIRKRYSRSLQLLGGLLARLRS